MRKWQWLLMFIAWSGVASAGAIPAKITYQGTLKQNGVPAGPGNYTLSFQIVDSPQATVQYWNSGPKTVYVSQGLFSVELQPTGINWQNITPYIQVSVGNPPQVLGPAEPINATVYALVANSVVDGGVTPSSIANGYGLIPTGTILSYGGSVVPVGYLPCDGSAVSRTTYSALFLALGTIWGAGDGSSTFNLPDLRGRTPIGSGLGPGLSNRALGSSLGEEAHLLTVAEMPSHNHGINDPGHVHGPQSGGQVFTMQEPGSPLNTASFGNTPVRAVSTTGSATTGITIQNAGGGSAHNNMQPSVVVSCIIKY